MNIGNFYFEPQTFTAFSIFTIDAQGVGGLLWFGVTVNDLFCAIGSRVPRVPI